MPLITTLNDIRLIPPPIFSTGPSLTMAYKTYPKPGSLDMSYTSTDKGKILQVDTYIISTCIIYWCVVSPRIGRGCGGSMFNVKGTVTSPMYPNLYRVSSVCRWDIAVPKPNSVKITFQGMFNLNII